MKKPVQTFLVLGLFRYGANLIVHFLFTSGRYVEAQKPDGQRSILALQLIVKP